MVSCITDLSKTRMKKYKLNFPVGELITNANFKQVVIDNDLESFFDIKLGREWEERTLRKAMEDGVVQVLLHWVSTNDSNDVWREDLRIFMGLEQTVSYDTSYKEITNYSIYYQVGTITSDISERLATFDEAFSIFKKSIIEFISGISY